MSKDRSAVNTCNLEKNVLAHLIGEFDLFIVPRTREMCVLIFVNFSYGG